MHSYLKNGDLRPIFFTLAVILLTTSVTPTTAQSGFCDNPATCCQNQTDVTALGDWHNCSIYYMCFGGNATVYNCFDPRPNYNPETNQCSEEVEGCVGGTRPPTTGMTTTTSLTTTTPTTPQTSSTTSRPPNGNCTEEGAYFIPYPGDCSKYMVCSNGVLLPEVHQCPPGTLFDPKIGECNLEANVECEPTCPDSGTATFPHDRNCSLYWLCSMGVPSLRQCPPGLVFDPKLSTCNIQDAVFCPNLCPPNETVNLPHSANCTLYWLCISGDPALRQCPSGLLFDPVLGQCNLEDEVDCSVLHYASLSLKEVVVLGSKNLQADHWTLDFETNESDGDSFNTR